MHRRYLGFAFVVSALGGCDDPKVIEPAPTPVVLPAAAPRAALQDAGVVVVTAKDLAGASGDGGVVDDVKRAAQGAGFGDVEFAIKKGH